MLLNTFQSTHFCDVFDYIITKKNKQKHYKHSYSIKFSLTLRNIHVLWNYKKKVGGDKHVEWSGIRRRR